MATAVDAVFVDTNVLLAATTPARAEHAGALSFLTSNTGDFARFGRDIDVLGLTEALGLM